jgi:hypothetical protein
MVAARKGTEFGLSIIPQNGPRVPPGARGPTIFAGEKSTRLLESFQKMPEKRRTALAILPALAGR